MILTLKFRNRLWISSLFLLSFDSFSQVLITPDNQGIGTSIPYSSSRLTLDGKDITNEVLSLKSDGSPSMIFYTPLVSSFANRAGYIGVSILEDGSYFDMGSYANSNLGLALLSNGNRKMYIKPNGNIGLGFNPIFPNAPVHIFTPEFVSEGFRIQTTDASTNPVMTFYRQSTKLGQIGASTGSSPDIEITSNLAGINFNTSGLAMKIGSNGNIGMPTVSPFRKLNITGRVNIDAGSLEFNGNSGNSGDILISGGPSASPLWAAPTPSTPKYAVSANNNSGQTLSTGSNQTEFILNFANEIFDDGNLLSGGVFTARHNGVYLVHIQIPMNYLDHYLKGGTIRVYKNADTTPIDTAFFDNAVTQFDFNTSNYISDRVVRNRNCTLENIFKLNNNDQLTFKFYVPANTSITIRPQIYIYAVN
jgi:hypothetical protein